MADIDPRWNTAAAESLFAWGISQASIDLVSHSENLVYRVETESGTYGLRVHRPGYHTRQELISEQQWIAALANSGCSVPTPQPMLTGDGLATVAISGEAPRFVSLVKWVNGYLLGSRLENAPRADRLRLIREIGVTNARLHATASAWQTPTGFRRTHWNADGLMGDDPVWGRFWEVPQLSGDQRDLLLRTRDRCKQHVERSCAASFGLVGLANEPISSVRSVLCKLSISFAARLRRIRSTRSSHLVDIPGFVGWPGSLGEIGVCFWLLIMGVKENPDEGKS